MTGVLSVLFGAAIVVVAVVAVVAFATKRRGPAAIASPVATELPTAIERDDGAGAARDARIALAFQNAALPARLPEVAGIDLDAAHHAHRREAAVGGDWYDAFRLADGRVVVTIGDVAGSGLAAAVAMSALRRAIRGAAFAVGDPAAILAAAEQSLLDDATGILATAFVGVLDPVTRRLSYASAGHPPPLVCDAAGSVTALRSAGFPLGAHAGAFGVEVVDLDPGSLLALYTDGLVEATRDLPQGERRLRDALARIAGHADSGTAKALVARALPDGPSDDVAVLTLAVRRANDEARFPSWTFDASDRFAAREARAGIAASLVAFGADESGLADADAVFSELLGNVVRYARGPVDIVLDAFGPNPVLNVLDRGPGFSETTRRLPDPLAESGRGLYIVAALTSALAIAPRPQGGTHVRTILAMRPRPRHG